MSKEIIYISLAIIISIFLSAIILIPQLKLLPHTTRQIIGRDLSVYQNFSFSPKSFIRLFFAHFWGIRNQGQSWGAMDTQAIGYIGFIPLILILLSLKKIIRHQNTKIFLIISLLGLFLSLGINLPFFQLFVSIIPVFAIFRNPMSFFIIYTFFMSLLAGFSLDFLSHQKINKLFIISIFIISAVSLFILVANYFYPQLAYDSLLKISSILGKNLSSFHSLHVDYLISIFIFSNIFIVTFLAFLGLVLKSPKIWLLLITIDLFIFTKSALFINNENIFKTNSQVVNYLQKNIGTDRYLSVSEAVPFSGLNDFCSSLTFQPPFAKEGPKMTQSQTDQKFSQQLGMLTPDYGVGQRLETISGYSTFILKDYNQIFQTSSSKSAYYRSLSRFNPALLQEKADAAIGKIDFSHIDFNDSLFDKLGLKYIITDRDLGLTHHKLILKSDGISLYENTDKLYRLALVAGDGSIVDTVPIKFIDDNSLAFYAPQKGIYILHDVYYPGWHAYVDGKKKEIIPVEGIFQGIFVDHDQASVRLNFLPDSFIIGRNITVISFIFVSLYLIYFYIKRK